MHHPIIVRKKFNDFFHKFIFNELRKDFDKSYKIIKNDDNHQRKSTNSGIIWLFWWQGYTYMPRIVKSCIMSIKRNSGSHRVILITKSNIKRYAKLPQYIYSKLRHKKISLTHFSDILRFNLLCNYGGLWVDSTMYCASLITDNYFGHIYTSGGYPDKYHQYVSTKWTGFLMGGYSNIDAFRFMNEFFEIYWKKHNFNIDYFLVDYGLDYVYKKNLSRFRYYTNNIAYKNNPHLYYLIHYLNMPYDSRKFHSICNDTKLFKLTYKQHFIKDNDTFYSRLIKGDLK